MKNPLDQAVAIMRAAGVPNAVFARAGQLLRISPEKQSAKTGQLEASLP
jgi:hypothetical protein